jgi:phosphoglycerate dehydrogenase-like enzyme
MKPEHGSRPVAVILDPIHPAGIDRLARTFDLILPDAPADDPRHGQASVAVVRTFPVTRDWMAARPGLRLIAKHGSGVDNIDIPGATERGVLVANTPGGTNSTAVAEGAVTLMLAVLRRVRDMDALMRDDRFDQRWSIELGDLTGGSLGLLGFGQIARQVARICGAGFGMDVGAYDPFVSADAMKAAGVRKVEALPELMRNDVISIHVPFSEQTRHVVGAKELAAMSAGAIIVNTARGGLIDEAALAQALVEGRIRGAGIDVFEAEPPPRDNPLLGLPNVVLSPHVAGVTSGSMKGMAMAVADVVETVLAGKRPATLLNREVLGETR